MSTPWGKRGFFYEAWANGGPTWERVSVKAEDCGPFSARHLAEERQVMGERRYRQEYCCEFADTTSAVFSRDLVEAAFSSDFGPLEL